MGLLDIINSITNTVQKGVSAVDNVNYTASRVQSSVSTAKQTASDIKQSIKPTTPQQTPEVPNAQVMVETDIPTQIQ